jgi:hypothetical protein
MHGVGFLKSHLPAFPNPAGRDRESARPESVDFAGRQVIIKQFS